MAQLFTPRERIVLWMIVLFIAILSALRLLQARQVVGMFQRGEIIRTVDGE